LDHKVSVQPTLCVWGHVVTVIGSVPKQANDARFYSRRQDALIKILAVTTRGVDDKVSFQPTLCDQG
ncbi:MAG: hypothetical protein EBV34_14920, partial [Betaproteobacteria bacterium]|nr:hypothetical protein [Betaproteobacteria bacterium]